MRTGKGGEQTIFGKKLERAQMQLAITAKCIAKTALRSGERWRIENDQIVFRFRFLRATEKCEHILLDPSHLETVSFGVLFSGRNLLGILFDSRHVGAAGARTRQRKCSLVRETIQNAAIASELPDHGIVRRLIEVKSGLLPAQKIDIELQTPDLDLDYSGQRGSLQTAGTKSESFGFPCRRIVSLNNSFPSEKIDNRGDDQRFLQIHRHRQGLENEIFAVAIENHAWKSIALAPNDSPEVRIDLSPIAVIGSLGNSAFEEIEIEVLTLPGKSAGHDLGFRIVNCTADQLVAAVFERNHVAIGRFTQNFEHLAGEDPVVAV